MTSRAAHLRSYLGEPGILVLRGAEALARLRADGTSRAVLDRLLSWQECQRLVDLPEYEALERRFVGELKAEG